MTGSSIMSKRTSVPNPCDPANGSAAASHRPPGVGPRWSTFTSCAFAAADPIRTKAIHARLGRTRNANTIHHMSQGVPGADWHPPPPNQPPFRSIRSASPGPDHGPVSAPGMGCPVSQKEDSSSPSTRSSRPSQSRPWALEKAHGSLVHVDDQGLFPGGHLNSIAIQIKLASCFPAGTLI